MKRRNKWILTKFEIIWNKINTKERVVGRSSITWNQSVMQEYTHKKSKFKHMFKGLNLLLVYILKITNFVKIQIYMLYFKPCDDSFIIWKAIFRVHSDDVINLKPKLSCLDPLTCYITSTLSCKLRWMLTCRFKIRSYCSLKSKVSRLILIQKFVKYELCL